MHHSFAAARALNVGKTWFLMGSFLVVVIGIGFVLTQYTGNPSFLYGSAVLSIVMNIVSYFNAETIALSSAHAVPADPAVYPQLHAIVEKLAQKLSIPKPDVYIINDPAPNAFATGRGPGHASVAATTGILSRMNEQELEGVMAHELSHVVNRDILVMTVAVVLAGVISVMADMCIRMSMFSSRRDNGDQQSMNPVILIATLAAIVIAPIAAQLLQLAISRRREYLADASGADLLGSGEGLASALEKIESYESPLRNASYTTAHLFISNPFGGHDAGKFLASLFSTHPPIEKRIAILRGEA